MADIQLKVRLILYNRGSILLLRQKKIQGGNYTLVGGWFGAEKRRSPIGPCTA